MLLLMGPGSSVEKLGILFFESDSMGYSDTSDGYALMRSIDTKKPQVDVNCGFSGWMHLSYIQGVIPVALLSDDNAVYHLID